MSFMFYLSLSPYEVMAVAAAHEMFCLFVLWRQLELPRGDLGILKRFSGILMGWSRMGEEAAVVTTLVSL